MKKLMRGGAAPRVLVAGLSLSAAAFVGLAVHEGYTSRAIVPTKGDRPTVGFGSTYHADGTPVKMGETTDPVSALKTAQAHISKDEVRFRASLPGVSMTQAEYDVYMDFLYQYGAASWEKSAMRQRLLAGDARGACDALLGYRFITDSKSHGAGWVKSGSRWKFDCSTPGNKVCRGVWTRQQARHAKCVAALMPTAEGE